MPDLFPDAPCPYCGKTEGDCYAHAECLAKEHEGYGHDIYTPGCPVCLELTED